MWPFANKSKLAAPEVKVSSEAQVNAEQGVRRRSTVEIESQEVLSTALRPSKSLSSLKLASDRPGLPVSASSVVQQSSEVFAHGEFFTPPRASEDLDNSIPKSNKVAPSGTAMVVDQDVTREETVVDGLQGRVVSAVNDEHPDLDVASAVKEERPDLDVDPIVDGECPDLGLATTNKSQKALGVQSSVGRSTQQIPLTHTQKHDPEPLIDTLKRSEGAPVDTHPLAPVEAGRDLSSAVTPDNTSASSLRAEVCAETIPESNGGCVPNESLENAQPERNSGEPPLPSCSTASPCAGQESAPTALSEARSIDPETALAPKTPISADTATVDNAATSKPLSNSTTKPAAITVGNSKKSASNKSWLSVLVRRMARNRKRRPRMFAKSGTRGSGR